MFREPPCELKRKKSISANSNEVLDARWPFTPKNGLWGSVVDLLSPLKEILENCALLTCFYLFSLELISPVFLRPYLQPAVSLI